MTPARQVSPNNPCPFLRALVAMGLLDHRVATIGDATDAIERVAATGEGSPRLPTLAIRLIALLSNGLAPGTLLATGLHGVKLNALRNGPFDKHGAGSRILDAKGRVVEAELERLREFATEKEAADGTREPGLDRRQLERMMDANYARAEGHRRIIDRHLMEGEWPVLLEVMGKRGKRGRYLSLREVRALFRQQRLPGGMTRRLGRGPARGA